jgi:hypothetical protein
MAAHFTWEACSSAVTVALHHHIAGFLDVFHRRPYAGLALYKLHIPDTHSADGAGALSQDSN